MSEKRSIAQAILPGVDAGELAGAAALVWRNGAVLETATVGRRDLVSGLPVARDTIFRIASMTKPVTTAAALMLLDEGRFDLDEPITQCAPELARKRVLRDPNGPLDQTDEATRPITFRDLLTHRSGLTYGDLHRGPIGRGHAETLGATYGMGVAVVIEPEKADPLQCRGGVGTIGWPGAYGSWWQADPNDRSVLIFLAHNMCELHQMASGIGLGVWSALATFRAIASA